MRYRITFLILLIISIIGITVYYYGYVPDTPKNNREEEIEKPIVKPLMFSISKEQFQQGDYIKVTINNIGNNKLRVDNNIETTSSNEIYTSGDNGYCYIPIAVTKLPGNYVINIYNNDSLVKTYNVKIESSVFETQKLTISQDIVKNTATAEAAAQYKAAVKEAQSYNIKEKLFEDNFIIPIEGEISTQFGLKRYTNNNLNPTRHYGLDIANDEGTPVKATASGKVVFANRLISAGNFVIIDHGMGILSYYAHMSSLNVKAMDMVKQGDIIGFVGSTGYATGAHLHFNITIKDISVSPWQFIQKS
jgi:hypothetical protein